GAAGSVGEVWEEGGRTVWGVLGDVQTQDLAVRPPGRLVDGGIWTFVGCTSPTRPQPLFLHHRPCGAPLRMTVGGWATFGRDNQPVFCSFGKVHDRLQPFVIPTARSSGPDSAPRSRSPVSRS